MNISARNVLKGKVKKLTHGVVNSEVVIELQSGTDIVSVITKQSAEDLELDVGKEVFTVIKATNVMVAVD